MSSNYVYLAPLLLSEDCVVHGMKLRSSLLNTDRIDHLYQDTPVDNVKFKLHYSDRSDFNNLIRIVQMMKPDEIYNLAACDVQSGLLFGISTDT